MSDSFNKARAAFMQRASAPSIPHAAFKLAWLLAYRYMNRESQTARPAQGTLARDLNLSIRTVQRLLDILEALGLVIVLGHGPNRASTYWIDPEKATAVSHIKTTPVSSIDGRIGDNRRQNRRQPVHEKATPVSPQLKKKNQEEEPRVESDSPPPVAARDSKRSPARKTPSARPVTKSELGDSFPEFWAIFPRHAARAAAERAYAAALEHGADVAALIEGARRYAAARTGEPERYTAHAATWLRGKRWEDPPPQADRAVLDNATGEFVEMAKPQQQERRRGPASMQELVEERQRLAAEGRAPW
jgi:hypothetical protein